MTVEDFKKLAEKHLFVLEGLTINKEGSKEMQIFGFDALYEQLRQHNVVGQSEQLADHKCKPMVNADWTYLRCECGKRFEPKG